MKIAAVQLHRYCLPLRAEWLTAVGSFSRREGYLVRIVTSDERYGYGDCAPLAGFCSETMAAAEDVLRACAPGLVGAQVADALDDLQRSSAGVTPAARCALETALLDLLAQADRMSLARYLCGGASASACFVNAALGSLMQVSGQAIAAACHQGFSVLKLKVGTATVDQELARLRRIAVALPAGTQLRLDANGAWCETDAGRFLAGCADLPIEMVEEPLADPQADTLLRLQAACVFPLALDESLAGFDLETLCAAPPVRRLVLKPSRLGGLLPALHIARRAAAGGLQCVVTSSVDSACGVTAAAHLAIALDNNLAHGLATSSWLASDLGASPGIAGGRLALSDCPGLGFTAQSALNFSALSGVCR
jgi:o-succinylbenzoate synthase